MKKICLIILSLFLFSVFAQDKSVREKYKEKLQKCESGKVETDECIELQKAVDLFAEIDRLHEENDKIKAELKEHRRKSKNILGDTVQTVENKEKSSAKEVSKE